MKKLTALVACTTFLIACQQQGQYEENRNTYHGAAIGAAIGAAAGGFSGKNEIKRGVIGGAIGALAGGAIGSYMDQQEQAMRSATQGTGIGVSRQGNNLFLNLPSHITFATDSSSISPSFKPSLKNVASVLQDYPNTVVEIMGHTDNTGSEAYNLKLSDRRAASVASYLTSQGVGQRVITTGLGESSPIASNDTATGRAQNRRVEIKITPISK